MDSFVPEQYGPLFAELLSVDRCRPLDAGQPDSAIWSRLSGLTPSAAFDPAPIRDESMAAACLSGVWLLYDHLDDSHRISQSISGSTGSFWHGIMHRREGDYSNAKYWFRNVGFHPVYDLLATTADKLATIHEVSGVLPAIEWDPMAFVDVCQQALQNRQFIDYCQAVQQAEWELLFDFCYHRAIET